MLELVRNPIAYIAARWTPTQRTLQRATMTALVMSVFIIVTGGAVRLTGSGLGCDTWPKCSSDSLVATSEMGIHGAIEFGNRMLTYVLSAAVGWAIVTSRAVKPRRRPLSRLAWAQFWLVMSKSSSRRLSTVQLVTPRSMLRLGSSEQAIAGKSTPAKINAVQLIFRAATGLFRVSLEQNQAG